MSLLAEIVLFVFLVLIMERLIGIQRTLAMLGSRLEEVIEEREESKSDADSANEWDE
jgi:hypothetical protein